MQNDFAIFVLSHGRGDNCKTAELLKKIWCGPWYIVIDTEDADYEKYCRRYGKERIKVFDKDAYMDKFDAFDNFRSKAAVIFARLACQDMAEQMGLEHYCQMDDDISYLEYRYIDGRKLKGKRIKHLDRIAQSIWKFQDSTKIAMLAFASQPFLLGSASGKYKQGLCWMGSNMFFLRTDKKIPWCCSVNEDNCTEIRMATQGEITFSVTSLALAEAVIEAGGGMQDAYADGKYYHNFARVMLHPSGCKLSKTGKVVTKKDLTFPKILDEIWRKNIER